MKSPRNIGLIGGGPAALFMFKQLIEKANEELVVLIFEKNDRLGAGMPYSSDGANPEHITNVSGNEIPELVTEFVPWLQKCPASVLRMYDIDPDHFSEYRVFPRLLFGRYLSDQFEMLLKTAAEKGIKAKVFLNTMVVDVNQHADGERISISTRDDKFEVDDVIICTGHRWPHANEDTPHYFDSPYPPSKLLIRTNHTVAIKGASLTAIDAVRTLARHNGKFVEKNGRLTYIADPANDQFKIVMHSRNGLLPAVRFHLDDPHLFRQSILTEEQIAAHRDSNNGFISLDYIFEHNYKDFFVEKDPEFYEQIKDLTLEEFVDKMMTFRENLDPFVLLKAEYAEAEKSIRRHESVDWKELLAVLSYTLNPPAKYFCAEDMIRLQTHLMPLISIVIAFVPQSSCRELMALHDCGLLELIAVGSDNTMEPHKVSGAVVTYTDADNSEHRVHYKTFVDCTGQPHLHYEQFPFDGLRQSKMLYPATLQFESESAATEYEQQHPEKVLRLLDKPYLRVPGVAINDNFQAVDNFGAFHPNVFLMAVPYIGGYNPDYSGLDFCEAASGKIGQALFA